MSSSKTQEMCSPVWTESETAAGAPKQRLVKGCMARDVTRLAAVSRAAASRAVNGVGSVSLKTRAKVLKAVSSLQYCPNDHAAESGRANGAILPKSVDQAAASSGVTRAQSSHPGMVSRSIAKGKQGTTSKLTL